jgi:hypothetical protein
MERLRPGEGATLLYEGARISSGVGGETTFNTTIKIQALNETELIFKSNSASANSSQTAQVTVEYQDGVPTYADEITALIYLPPECLTQSLQGNLKWTTQITYKTYTFTVTNSTSQTLNYTTPLGSFQSLNITLALTGEDSGTLTFIYDVNSGTLLYERWTPIEGDIIVLQLSAMTNAPETQQTIFDYILPAVTLALPVAILLHQTGKAFQRAHTKRTRNKHQSKNAAIKSGFPKKPFYALLAGATLNLASIFLPWSQFQGLQTYLPMSLPSALTESPGPFASTQTYTTISLIAYATAILAWISIGIHVYTKKEPTPQLAAIISGILAFASAAILLQARWTPSFGPLIMTIGGILTITAIVVAQVRHKTNKEERVSEDTLTY